MKTASSYKIGYTFTIIVFLLSLTAIWFAPLKLWEHIAWTTASIVVLGMIFGCSWDYRRVPDNKKISIDTQLTEAIDSLEKAIIRWNNENTSKFTKKEVTKLNEHVKEIREAHPKPDEWGW